MTPIVFSNPQCLLEISGLLSYLQFLILANDELKSEPSEHIRFPIGL